MSRTSGLGFSPHFLPNRELEGLKTFCNMNNITQKQLDALFIKHVASKETNPLFVGNTVSVNEIKTEFMADRIMNEITDLMLPRVLLLENSFVGEPKNFTRIYFSRLIVAGYEFCAMSSPDLILDFISALMGRFKITPTNTMYLFNLNQVLKVLTENLEQTSCIEYLLRHLQEGLQETEEIPVSAIIKLFMRYPALAYNILRWRDAFRRRLFGSAFFENREPMPSLIAQQLNYSPKQGRCKKRHRQASNVPTDVLEPLNKEDDAETQNSAPEDTLYRHEFDFSNQHEIVEYTARAILGDVLRVSKREGLLNPLFLIERPQRPLESLTTANITSLKNKAGYKHVRGLILEARLSVSIAEHPFLQVLPAESEQRLQKSSTGERLIPQSFAVQVNLKPSRRTQRRFGYSRSRDRKTPNSAPSPLKSTAWRNVGESSTKVSVKCLPHSPESKADDVSPERTGVEPHPDSSVQVPTMTTTELHDTARSRNADSRPNRNPSPNCNPSTARRTQIGQVIKRTFNSLKHTFHSPQPELGKPVTLEPLPKEFQIVKHDMWLYDKKMKQGFVYNVRTGERLWVQHVKDVRGNILVSRLT